MLRINKIVILLLGLALGASFSHTSFADESDDRDDRVEQSSEDYDRDDARKQSKTKQKQKNNKKKRNNKKPKKKKKGKRKSTLCHATPSGQVVVIRVKKKKAHGHVRHGDYLPVTYYADSDADGYGDPDVSMTSCDPVDGFVADNTDLDDSDPSVTNVRACVLRAYYPDEDGDGFGDYREESNPRYECDELPGLARNFDDQNDLDPRVTNSCDSNVYSSDNRCLHPSDVPG